MDVVASTHYERGAYRSAQPVAAELTDEETARLEAIETELEGLYQGEESEETTARIAMLEAETARIEEKPPVFDPADRARVGAVLHLAQGGVTTRK